MNGLDFIKNKFFNEFFFVQKIYDIKVQELTHKLSFLKILLNKINFRLLTLLWVKIILFFHPMLEFHLMKHTQQLYI